MQIDLYTSIYCKVLVHIVRYIH